MRTIVMVLLALLLSWLTDGLLPEAPGDVALPAAGPAETDLEEGGHGAYCRVADRPAVFLGRDVPELDSYSAFQGWCEAKGGVTGWAA